MYDVIKIFLNPNAYTELEDAYVDKQQDLRSQVFQEVKKLAKSAKMTEINEIVLCNLEKENEETNVREMKQEQVPFKDIDFKKYENIKSDPEWVPESLKEHGHQVYKLQVGPKTSKFLKLFAKHYCARIDLYNESLDKGDKDYDKKVAKEPTCIEQIFHEQLINALMSIVTRNMDRDFDQEFKEINKAESKPKLKGTRDTKK